MSARLDPARGPADPPSSRPESGVLGGTVFAFSFDPAAGVQRIDVPGWDAVDLTSTPEVHWAFYADGDDATLAPYAALAVTVDVRFSDGSRLSDIAPVRDRYGFPITPQEQFSAQWSMPEQWNANTVSTMPVGARTGALEIVLGAPSLTGAAGPVRGFVEVAVSEAAPAPASVVERVDTRRGTHSGDRFSRGNTIPALARPHGFTFFTPATDARNGRWPYRWSVHDDPAGRRLEALQFSHQPSPWIGDRGVLQVMPSTGEGLIDPEARRRWIARGSERAHPHLWAATLDTGQTVEATATVHGASVRVIAADASARTGFVIDQLTDDGELDFGADGSFEGWVAEGDPGWGNAPRTFFAGRVIGAVSQAGLVRTADRTRTAGEMVGRGTLEVRIACSFISRDQARRALEHELPDARSFEDLVREAHDEWLTVLSAVTLPEGDVSEYERLADEENRARIASALYRLHLYPNSSAENAGTPDAPRTQFVDPFAAAAPHTSERTGAPVVDGDLVVNNGYWDTYRTVWPALALLDSDHTGLLLDGLVQQYRRGGYMARWSAPGYVDSMVGTSSDQIFADGHGWGAEFDVADAFDSGWRNACEPSPTPLSGRKGIGRARFTGFVSRATHEGMSWSLENATSDDALGRWAERLAAASSDANDAARYRAFARYFANRALSYRSLFDPDAGFFRGRAESGERATEPFDPRVWGGDYVETNAWGMSVSAVHDGAGLAQLHGGPAGLAAHLDRLFAEPETAHPDTGGSYGFVIHEQREARAQRSGMCAVSNQPAHHIPYMYAFSDRPWAAGITASALAQRLFAGAHVGQGFPGDEDNGEMSAWWLWAALGLYPLHLGSGELLIGAPLFDDISVHRANGAHVRIRSVRANANANANARYLTGVRVNGRAHVRGWLPVDVFGGHDDVEIELTFGEQPNPALWPAMEPARAHTDLTGTAGAPLGHPRAAEVFDDGQGESGVVLEAGEWVGWRWESPVTITDVTLTLGRSGIGSHALDVLEWQSSTDGEQWDVMALTHAEPLLPDRTTPAEVAHPRAVRAVRVCARARVDVRQLEAFALQSS